jgi:four helix bundle protein
MRSCSAREDTTRGFMPTRRVSPLSVVHRQLSVVGGPLSVVRGPSNPKDEQPVPRPGFQKLEVYRLAERLANEIWDATNNWHPFAKETVGRQLVRAADSVGANIAEGAGRGTFQDNRRFVRIARGSLNEVQHWLRLSYQRQLLNDEQVQRLRPIIEELGPRLNAYLKSIGKVPPASPQPLRDQKEPPQRTRKARQEPTPDN